MGTHGTGFVVKWTEAGQNQKIFVRTAIVDLTAAVVTFSIIFGWSDFIEVAHH